MFQITGEHGHVDGDDYLYLMKLRDTHQLELRHESCDDDVESTAPYISLLPQESDKEHGSPINWGSSFRHETDAEIDEQIQYALLLVSGY